MEDSRIKWIKSCVYTALDLEKDELFENLLNRDERKAQKELVALLDKPSEEYPPALIFYCITHAVEEMVEVVEGICSSLTKLSTLQMYARLAGQDLAYRQTTPSKYAKSSLLGMRTVQPYRRLQ